MIQRRSGIFQRRARMVCTVLPAVLFCMGYAGSAETETPYAQHGALRVEGTDLVDQNGDPYQLYGMSTHGIGWFPQYVSRETFETLRDDWNTNCVRLAMYTAEYNGYCTGGDQESLGQLVRDGIEYAGDLDMYVIVDWHVLQDQDPMVYKEEAVQFFDEISAAYGDCDHILYEICNEPNGSGTWEEIRAYAQEVIPVIRANDDDAVILVGTPVWSQEIDAAAQDPLDFENIMYTVHFYAATHTDWLRDRVRTCIDRGLPVFVSEFGICDASGNGALDLEQAENWKELIEHYGLSFFCWNLSNKDESSSVLRPDCGKTAGWTEEELSGQGKWITEWFRNK